MITNLFLFIVVLVVSFIVVRIGAIAFQLTGLEWSLAKFQALSCFTGTGFTTREAELITSNKQRRRIASVLIVLGHAGLVVLIATFANSMIPRSSIESKISKPILPLHLPDFLVVWVNLSIIIVVVYIIYRLFTHEIFAKKLTNFLRKKVIRREIFKRVSFEELLLATGGYGVTKIEIQQGSPVLNKTLLEAQLRKLDITVLAIVRSDKTIANPRADAKILLGDELICFGKLGSIRDKICTGLE